MDGGSLTLLCLGTVRSSMKSLVSKVFLRFLDESARRDPEWCWTVGLGAPGELGDLESAGERRTGVVEKEDAVDGVEEKEKGVPKECISDQVFSRWPLRSQVSGARLCVQLRGGNPQGSLWEMCWFRSCSRSCSCPCSCFRGVSFLFVFRNLEVIVRPCSSS